MPFDAPLLDESLAAKILDVAFHPRVVTVISEPSQIVCGDNSELSDIGERLDFRFPQGIRAVADTIDCSPAVISIRRLSGFLIPVRIRPGPPIVVSRGPFRQTTVFAPGVAMLPEKCRKIR